MVTDWGAHHLDIAQWGLGMDDSGPAEVRPPEQKDAKRGATLVYADGVTVTHEDGTSCEGQVAKAEKEFLKDAKVRLYVSTDHVTDFLERVRDRRKPITNEQVGGRTAICCHLMNQAYFNHARILWDPAACAFADGTGDPAWLTRDYRAPWSV